MSQSDISIGRGPDPRSTGDPLGPLHEHWKSYALQGALMAAIGTLAIFVPWAAMVTSRTRGRIRWEHYVDALLHGALDGFKAVIERLLEEDDGDGI